MPTTKVELNAEQKAWLTQVRAKSAKDRDLDGPPFPGIVGESIPFFLELRGAVGRIKAARENAGLSLAEISTRSGIDESVLVELEAGNTKNPSWKLLGDYAKSVGVKIGLSIDPV